MSDRDRAVATIEGLVKEFHLEPEALQHLWPEADAESKGSVLASVMGYLGGVLVFAGMAAFIAVNWDSLGSFARVIVTLGLGISLYVSGLIAHQSLRWLSLAAPIYLAAFLLQPTGMLVAFDEYGGGGDYRYAILVTCFAFLIQALITNKLQPHGVLVFASVFFGVGVYTVIFDLVGIDGDLTGLAIGASLVLLSLGLNRYQYIANLVLWSAVGCITTLIALWELVVDSRVEIIFPIVCAGFVLLSVRTRLRTFLGFGVTGLLIYLGYFTAENFADSLGWPLVLMFIGVIFVGVGYWALSINRRYLKADVRT